MVKTLNTNASYRPLRSLNLIKLKNDYLEGLGKSINLVPVGAYHDKVKCTSVYEAYFLACYNEDKEDFSFCV